MAEPTLAAVLGSISCRMATDSRDWSLDERDAFLYGVLVGWDCEEQHEHNNNGCGTGAVDELAELHGWPAENVGRMREQRRVIARWTRG